MNERDTFDDARGSRAGDYASKSLAPSNRLMVAVLRELAITPAVARDLLRNANRNGTGFQDELLASGIVAPGRYFRAVADVLGLEFCEAVEADRLLPVDGELEDLLAAPFRELRAYHRDRDGSLNLLIAPDMAIAGNLVTLLSSHPSFAATVRVVEPGRLRAAIWQRSNAKLRRQAVTRLHSTLPDFSARRLASPWQSVMLGVLATLFVVGLILDPATVAATIHVIAAAFFFSCSLLRLCAAASVRRKRYTPLRDYDPADLPRYSVLVALRDEADMVGDLLVALGRLHWPRSKLEIKIICEADDAATIGALRAHELVPSIEVVIVPPAKPRTKPKALAYALPTLTGDYVTLFDAEDQPHPLQLLEAWQAFRHGSPQLACVQAPLVVPRGKGFLAGMFAFEYAALFRGLLPWLARHGFYVPLGGTSNHFRGLM